MTFSIHKGISLDDKFLKAVGKAQAALEALVTLNKEFDKNGHNPVASQVMSLGHLAEDFEKLKKSFQASRPK